MGPIGPESGFISTCPRITCCSTATLQSESYRNGTRGIVNNRLTPLSLDPTGLVEGKYCAGGIGDKTNQTYSR